MAKTIRTAVKARFDKIVYSSAGLNRALRNINKIFSSATSFRLRPYGELHLELSSGLRFRLAVNETSNVGKKLFWNGPDNYEYTRLFEALAKRCACFADIGANIGYYSLIAARANPSMIVYAFEPASGPLHYLRENVRLNRLESRIRVASIALSNSQGNVEFHEFRSSLTNGKYYLGGAGKMLIATDSRDNVVPILVPAKTMDSYFENVKPIPDLIKMDTEGTENMILEGGSAIISRYRPIIICETLFNVIEDKLESIMRRHNYRFFNVVNGRLSEVNTLSRNVDNGVSDCFFVPPEKINLIEQFL